MIRHFVIFPLEYQTIMKVRNFMKGEMMLFGLQHLLLVVLLKIYSKLTLN